MKKALANESAIRRRVTALERRTKAQPFLLPDRRMAPQALNPRQLRRTVLVQSRRVNVGHIGSCLSVVDILAAIYGQLLRASSPNDPDRDRFVLSKGHAALALYATLAEKGWLSRESLDSFCADGSRIAVHPEHSVPGVDFATGSLGQGLSMAAGCALAGRLQRSARLVYCLISDAECNEGSIWEAAMFAAHYRLDNLRLVIDWNKQQALGLTKDVINTDNLPERWRAFGWAVREVDGHSVPDLVRSLSEPATGRPHVTVAHTVFGRGVSFMESGIAVTQTHIRPRPINWHYLPMSDHEFQIALNEVEGAR
jgi:transketolase